MKTGILLGKLVFKYINNIKEHWQQHHTKQRRNPFYYSLHTTSPHRVHDLVVGYEPVTVFLESLWHRVKPLEELRGIWLDDSRREQLRQFLKEFGRKLVILLVRLQIRLINGLIYSISNMPYRPVEILVLMLLQERCPDKHICHLSLLGHIFGEGPARTNN